jgi:hypothetical protein
MCCARAKWHEKEIENDGPVRSHRASEAVLPSVHEEVDQDQYNCRYTQKPPQEIFAHYVLLVIMLVDQPNGRLRVTVDHHTTGWTKG